MDAISRNQGMKGGSVPAPVTDWNDEADEERATFWREYLGKLKHSYFTLLFAAEWMLFRGNKARSERAC
jgi:hypothetical protein